MVASGCCMAVPSRSVTIGVLSGADRQNSGIAPNLTCNVRVGGRDRHQLEFLQYREGVGAPVVKEVVAATNRRIRTPCVGGIVHDEAGVTVRVRNLPFKARRGIQTDAR